MSELSKVYPQKSFKWKSYLYSVFLGMPLMLIYFIITTMDLNSIAEIALVSRFQEVIHLTTNNPFDKIFEIMKEISVYFFLIQFLVMGFAYVYYDRNDIPYQNQMKEAFKVMFFSVLATMLFFGLANHIMNAALGHLPSKEVLNNIVADILKEKSYVFVIVLTFIVGISVTRFIRIFTFIILFLISPFLLLLSIVWRKEESLFSLSESIQSGFDLLIECILPMFLLWGIYQSVIQRWDPYYLIVGTFSFEVIINVMRYAMNKIYWNFKRDKDETEEI